jgi:hypothetical protein
MMDLFAGGSDGSSTYKKEQAPSLERGGSLFTVVNGSLRI